MNFSNNSFNVDLLTETNDDTKVEQLEKQENSSNWENFKP